MPIKTKKSKQRGFTLIEVIITIFMIGVTLVIYRVTSQTVIVNRGNRYKEVALRIADQNMQNLRTTAFGSLPSSGSFSDPLISTLPSGAGTVTVTSLNAKTKDVKVTVSWIGQASTTIQKVELETYITQGGIGQ